MQAPGCQEVINNRLPEIWQAIFDKALCVSRLHFTRSLTLYANFIRNGTVRREVMKNAAPTMIPLKCIIIWLSSLLFLKMRNNFLATFTPNYD